MSIPRNNLTKDCCSTDVRTLELPLSKLLYQLKTYKWSPSRFWILFSNTVNGQFFGFEVIFIIQHAYVVIMIVSHWINNVFVLAWLKLCRVKDNNGLFIAKLNQIYTDSIQTKQVFPVVLPYIKQGQVMRLCSYGGAVCSWDCLLVYYPIVPPSAPVSSCFCSILLW